MDLILVTLDLVGTFVFALSGALVGVRHRLDLFGVLVLSFVAGNGGGVMRDTMIGATPTIGRAETKLPIGSRPFCRKGERSIRIATRKPRPQPAT